MNLRTGAPVRVGMLFSETGVTAAIERSERLATQLAVEEINASGGIGGRPLELVSHDPQSSPAAYRTLAESLWPMTASK